MGFHKRFVNRKVILRYWTDGGIQGIHNCMSADALIVNSDCSDLIELYNEGKWSEIDQLISKELFESGEHLSSLRITSTNADVSD